MSTGSALIHRLQAPRLLELALALEIRIKVVRLVLRGVIEGMTPKALLLSEALLCERVSIRARALFGERASALSGESFLARPGLVRVNVGVGVCVIGVVAVTVAAVGVIAEHGDIVNE
jgi:hypothetical protein